MKVLTTQQKQARLAFGNILFVTDLSSPSWVGLRYALALARHYDAKIYIIHGVAANSVEEIANEIRQRAEDQAPLFEIRGAKGLRLSGMLDGVRHEVMMGGDGRKALAKLLRNREFDMAISGIASCEGQRTLLEPTIEEAIHESQCPALSVASRPRDSADGELKNLLFATDFSPESLGAARYALSLAQEFEARLTLLHVVEGFEPILLDERADIAKPFKLWLGKLVPDEARLWCELEFAVDFGRPAERILQAAWENHADLIVLGARGLERMTSPGLNARKIMCSARCPVLTVSGALDNQTQERFWRAAAAASATEEQEMVNS